MGTSTVRIPTIRGVIDRRILVNYRVEPTALARVLPAPFRPQLVGGCGVAGICLIRLKEIRPRGAPRVLGASSENAAHRIAVEWLAPSGEVRTGVYIPRRDTSSRLNALMGGRLFPGVHHLAKFEVDENDEWHRVGVQSRDDRERVVVEGHTANKLPEHSVFPSLAAASDFFEAGAVGYSPNLRRDGYDGLELRSFNWRVEPLQVTHVESSFFDQHSRFPPGSVEFDCALLMRGIEHEWRKLQKNGGRITA